jgi:hypothetical protein
MDGETEEKKQLGWKEILKEMFKLVLIFIFIITTGITLIALCSTNTDSDLLNKIREFFQPRFTYKDFVRLPNTGFLFNQQYLGVLEVENDLTEYIGFGDIFHPVYSSGNKILIYQDQNLEQVAREIELPGNVIDKSFVYFYDENNTAADNWQYYFLTQNNGRNYITAFLSNRSNNEPQYNLQQKFSIETKVTKIVPVKDFDNFLACIDGEGKALIVYKSSGEVFCSKTFAKKSAFFMIGKNIVQYDGQNLVLFTIDKNDVLQKTSVLLPDKGSVSKASLDGEKYSEKMCFTDGSNAYYLDEYFNYIEKAPFKGVEKSLCEGDFLVCKDKVVSNILFSDTDTGNKPHFYTFESSTVFNDKYDFWIPSYWGRFEGERFLLVKNNLFSFSPIFAWSRIRIDEKVRYSIYRMQGTPFGRVKGFFVKSHSELFKVYKIVYFYTDHGVYRFKEMAED